MPMITQKNNLIKYCRICNDELVVGSNWTKYNKVHYKYICSRCGAIDAIERFRMSHPDAKRRHEYKSKEYWNLHPEEYSARKKEYRDNFYGTIKYIIGIKKHRQTEKYKIGQHIRSKKAKAKRRGLGSIFLFDNPFDDNIPVVGHHISDAFVVFLPKSLHLNHYGKNHREDLKPYVEGIYGISYTIV